MVGREEKMRAIEELRKMIDEFSVVGIVDMGKLPSRQLQEIRKKTRNDSIIKSVRKTVLAFAIQQSKKENIRELEKIIPRLPGIVFTKKDAFKFYSFIDSLKFPTFAKENDTAPDDVKISAGPTSLTAGPIIGELTKAGIPVGVEEGRVVVKKDVTVVKKGEKISKELSNALRKLDIRPILVGLNVVGLYEDGKLYTKGVLDLVKIFPGELGIAHRNALNLSVFISYPTKDNIKFLLAKAFNSAKAIESKIGGAK
jgi:large subunit ribosomal protein L10